MANYTIRRPRTFHYTPVQIFRDRYVAAEAKGEKHRSVMQKYKFPGVVGLMFVFIASLVARQLLITVVLRTCNYIQCMYAYIYISVKKTIRYRIFNNITYKNFGFQKKKYCHNYTILFL